MNIKKCSGNIDIFLNLKVYFSLVTCKINNLIALRSTNQITEISAPDDYGNMWLDNCLIHFKLMMYKRYVDDILVCSFFT